MNDEKNITLTDQDINVLAHHGILGQKWGIENGPPYPLKRSDYSAKEKKLNPVYEGKKSSVKNKLDEVVSSIKNFAKNGSKKTAEATKSAKEKAAKLKEEADELAKKKDYKHMTNDELQSYINRAKLENQYKELILPKKKDGFFITLAKDTGNILRESAKTFATKTMTEVVIPKLIKKMNEEQEPNSVRRLRSSDGNLERLSDNEIRALSERATRSRIIRENEADLSYQTRHRTTNSDRHESTSSSTSSTSSAPSASSTPSTERPDAS